jgi:uncharacterized iron-regulated membrane protein
MILLHRYVGLAIAALLVVECLTGCVAVYKNELDRWLNQSLCYCDPPADGAKPLDPLVLREQVDQQLPKGVSIWELSLVEPQPGLSSEFTVNFDQSGPNPNVDLVYANPYTGKLIGMRSMALGDNWRNIIEFIFTIHHSLALGDFGMWVLGSMAVLWTVDCFVALYLTFPTPASKKAKSVPRPNWFVRWMPAWLIKASSSFAAIFTFHRASGLWMWLFLLMFAWSSVALRMMPVYEPVNKLLFPGYDYSELQPLKTARNNPKLGWEEALKLGQMFMEEQAQERGFIVMRPFILSHEPGFGFYRYQVQSSLDPSDHWCDTVVWMDSDTCEFDTFWAPTGISSGGSFSTWLKYMHFGWVGGSPFRLLIFLVGIGATILTITGILIWWRKLRGRARSSRLNADYKSLPELVSRDVLIASSVFLLACVITFFVFH